MLGWLASGRLSAQARDAKAADPHGWIGTETVKSLYSEPKTNADGSVDVYFGPQAAIGKEKNWIKTIAGKGWFLYLRFYSPTEAEKREGPLRKEEAL